MSLIGWPFDRQPLQHGVIEGIPWAICTGPMPQIPSINGYAQIPAEGHPWCAIEDINDIDPLVDCPGGLTFGPMNAIDLAAVVDQMPPELMPPELREDARKIEPRPAKPMAESGGWIGFDTGHAFDVWTDEALADAGITREPWPGRLDGLMSRRRLPDPYDTHWTLERVARAAKSLANQIACARDPEWLAERMKCHQ